MKTEWNPHEHDLVKFLKERIDEDEADANRMPTDTDIYAAMQPQAMNGRSMEFVLRRISSRERLLREVEAKRAIMAEHPHRSESSTGFGCETCHWDREFGFDGGGSPCATLRQLAAVYAEHPEYEQDWAATRQGHSAH